MKGGGVRSQLSRGKPALVITHMVLDGFGKGSGDGWVLGTIRQTDLMQGKWGIY